MGTYDFDAEGLYRRVYEAVDTRLEAMGGEIVRDAKNRCPVRKEKGDRRRGHRVVFLPGQAYRFGNATLTAREIAVAADRLGINLGKSARARQRAGKGELELVTRRPRRRIPVREKLNIRYSDPAKKVRKINIRYLTNKEQSKYDRQVNAITSFEKTGGALRASIQVYRSSGNGTRITYTISAGDDDQVDYARYVEFPTSRTAAQPFMLPALKSMQGRFQRRIAGALR